MVKFDTAALNAVFNADIAQAQRSFEDAIEKNNKLLSQYVSSKTDGVSPIFDQLAKDFHVTAAEKGFWGEPVPMDQIAGKLALIHSEVTEVLEALRKSQGADKVTEEFADILIRTMDLYGVLVEAGEADPDLWNVMVEKARTNKERPPKHGNRWG